MNAKLCVVAAVYLSVAFCQDEIVEPIVEITSGSGSEIAETPEPTTPPTTTRSLMNARCQLPLVKDRDFGACGFVVRYAYMVPLGRCVAFYGCINMGGGGNNFNTLLECQFICYQRVAAKNVATTASLTSLAEQRCSAALQDGVDFGDCGQNNNNLYRFFYNSATKACTRYIGCARYDGSGNNFPTTDLCQQLCVSSEPS